MDVLKKRLDRASCQLIALHEAKRKAEIAMRFELVALTRVKWYLLDRSIGLTSVATQTPVSPTDNKQLRHVRYAPITRGSTNTNSTLKSLRCFKLPLFLTE